MKRRKPRPQPLRNPLPDREDVALVDECGRQARGRAGDVRRLYREERCSVDELAAYFNVQRHTISMILRAKSALRNRRNGLQSLGRARARTTFTRDPIARAFQSWLRAS